jgi:hypothetical protein
MEQLELVFEATPARSYSCCGAAAPPDFHTRAYPDFPHTEDCSNPDIGQWIDRWGRTIRRLHCIQADGTCPTGGRFVCDSTRVYDPYGGRCCLDLKGKS